MPPQTRQRVVIDGRELSLTNLDRALWPEDGITKGQLIEYLLEMAELIIPHLNDRPLVLTRYPSGVAAASFYQKDTPDTAPGWIQTFAHRGTSGSRAIEYLLCDHPAVLAWLGNQAAIEIHPWFSRIDQPDLPDIAVFDLDPVDPAGFDECRALARVMGEALDSWGIRGWLKTSGATGLHLYVPIERRYGYPEIAWSVGRVCDIVHHTMPATSTRLRKVAARPAGTVYLDHLQNVRGKTLAMAYGPRPHPGAPVSMPITWEELSSIRPGEWTVRTMPERARLLGDLFRPVAGGHAQDWGRVMDFLGGPP